MEDLYSILGCSVNSTIDEIKQKYRALARLCHPDSCHVDDTRDNQYKFVKLSKAYEILSDGKMRQEYNTRWNQLSLLQEFPVQDTIEFEELEFDDKEKQYTYPCRCGDSFLLSDIDVFLEFCYASCSSCSLCIQIVYPSKSSNNEIILSSICDK